MQHVVPLPEPRDQRPFFHRAHQDQPIARAGEQHIEDALFLRQVFRRLAAGDSPAGERFPAYTEDGIGVGQGEAQLRVPTQAVVRLLAAEAAAQLRGKDHRKFQPLALVYAHQAHHIVVFAQGVRRVLPALAGDGFRVAQKARQSARAVFLIGGGARAEQV